MKEDQSFKDGKKGGESRSFKEAWEPCNNKKPLSIIIHKTLKQRNELDTIFQI